MFLIQKNYLFWRKNPKKLSLLDSTNERNEVKIHPLDDLSTCTVGTNNTVAPKLLVQEIMCVTPLLDVEGKYIMQLIDRKEITWDKYEPTCITGISLNGLAYFIEHMACTQSLLWSIPKSCLTLELIPRSNPLSFTEDSKVLNKLQQKSTLPPRTTTALTSCKPSPVAGINS